VQNLIKHFTVGMLAYIIGASQYSSSTDTRPPVSHYQYTLDSLHNLPRLSALVTSSLRRDLVTMAMCLCGHGSRAPEYFNHCHQSTLHSASDCRSLMPTFATMRSLPLSTAPSTVGLDSGCVCKQTQGHVSFKLAYHLECTCRMAR